MIVGTGIDMVEIARIRDLSERQPKLFERILTVRERELAQSRHDPIKYLANRFAAKEAVSKALGTGIGQHVSFQDIEVTNQESGAPTVELGGSAKQLADDLGVARIHISISDTDQCAMAQVILESD